MSDGWEWVEMGNGCVEVCCKVCMSVVDSGESKEGIQIVTKEAVREREREREKPT